MKMEKRRSRAFSRITVVLVIVAILTVVGTIIVTNLYEGTFFAERKFRELSASYYENSVYPKLASELQGDELKKAFDIYKKEGYHVRLREILNHEFVENDQNYRSYFETKAYSCDTNASYVDIIPKEPYGKTDYDLNLQLVCKNL